jgi:hypothetical protein
MQIFLEQVHLEVVQIPLSGQLVVLVDYMEAAAAAAVAR